MSRINIVYWECFKFQFLQFIFANVKLQIFDNFDIWPFSKVHDKFFFSGLSETAGHLRVAASSSQGLPAAQRPVLPNLNSLAKKAINSYSLELGLLSPPGSAAAESLSKTTGVNYASVMATLAKAITICLAEKSVAEEKFHKYNEVTTY